MLKRQNRRVYMVAFMDDHSRFITGYGIHASQSAALVLEVVRAAIVAYGTPQEMLTDNGSQYVTWRGTSAFHREMDKRGIKHIVAKPQRPQTLGKIERFWGTLWRECIETSVFFDLDDARRRIGHFIDYYNFQRVHQGIDGLVPADRFFGAASEVLATLRAGGGQRAGIGPQRRAQGAVLRDRADRRAGLQRACRRRTDDPQAGGPSAHGGRSRRAGGRGVAAGRQRRGADASGNAPAGLPARFAYGRCRGRRSAAGRIALGRRLAAAGAGRRGPGGRAQQHGCRPRRDIMSEAKPSMATASPSAPPRGAAAREGSRGPRFKPQAAVSRDAQRVAAAILEVLAGVRTPTEAAAAVGLSVPRYYLWEQRALEGLVRACEPRPKGQAVSERHQIAVLEKEVARLRQDCARQQALVRASQRTIGLAASPPAAAKPRGKAAGGKRSGQAGNAAVGKAKRKRRPVARALKAAAALQARPAKTVKLRPIRLRRKGGRGTTECRK